MSKYQLVVFDMAGTTVLDRGNVAQSFTDAFRASGIEVEEAEVKKVMGWRKIDAIRLLLDRYHPQPGKDQKELIRKIHDAFISNMIRFYEEDTDIKPLPFAEEIFKQCAARGIKIALNTGFTRAITDTILKRLHWNKETAGIDYVIASDEVPEGRPYPFMIETIMQKLEISDASRVAKIGDTEVDVQEGRNAQCGLVVSVTTGAYTRAQLEKYSPDYIIDSLTELPALLS